MKKKLMLLAFIIVTICSAITANQGGNVNILDAICSCCEQHQNTRCYELYQNTVLSCGIGYNKCDVAAPPETK